MNLLVIYNRSGGKRPDAARYNPAQCSTTDAIAKRRAPAKLDISFADSVQSPSVGDKRSDAVIQRLLPVPPTQTRLAVLLHPHLDHATAGHAVLCSRLGNKSKPYEGRRAYHHLAA
jgi:hypothetical protein